MSRGIVFALYSVYVVTVESCTRSPCLSRFNSYGAPGKYVDERPPEAVERASAGLYRCDSGRRIYTLDPKSAAGGLRSGSRLLSER